MLAAKRILCSRPTNGLKAIRFVMFHHIDNRDYCLYELSSGRFVWFVYELEVS